MWSHVCKFDLPTTLEDGIDCACCGAKHMPPIRICPHDRTVSTADGVVCVHCGAAKGPLGDWFLTLPAVDVEDREGISSVLETQVGGDHYKKLGQYQPWEVLRAWLTPEEFRGYMKGTAIAYLAREQDKGKDVDIEKAMHTLQGLLELTK